MRNMLEHDSLSEHDSSSEEVGKRPDVLLKEWLIVSCADPIRWVVPLVDDVDLSNSRRIGYDL
jgi:hypothetical protein